ncbi:MAG: CoA-binding protein [Janthinobacterium lividum]
MTSQDQTIAQLLADSRTIAVVGLSPKPDRPSFGVSRYMQSHGYRIIPVNPGHAGSTILGEHCYATLTQAAHTLGEQGVTIDIVNCFRRSELIMPIADEAIAIRTRALWMQQDIVNEAAADKARAAGMIVVMDRCIKIDHMMTR